MWAPWRASLQAQDDQLRGRRSLCRAGQVTRRLSSSAEERRVRSAPEIASASVYKWKDADTRRSIFASAGADGTSTRCVAWLYHVQRRIGHQVTGSVQIAAARA